MLSYNEIIDFLAEKLGILPEFSTEGKIYVTSFETKVSLLKNLGYLVDNEKNARASYKKYLEKAFKRSLPPVIVARIENETISVLLSFKNSKKSSETKHVDYTIEFEDGEKISDFVEFTDFEKLNEYEEKFYQIKWDLNIPQKLGYHKITVSGDDLVNKKDSSSFIVVPTKCYEPEILKENKLPWGMPLQLYALRSENNQGIGDFTDLKNYSRIAKKYGADIVGINPINVAFMTNVETASPYYSSSRMFLNPLYIDIFNIENPGEKFEKLVKSKTFKDDLKKARESKIVDYTLVGKIKSKALEAIYSEFKGSKDFDKFCKEGGKELDSVAIYQVLAEYFASKKIYSGFKSWGKEYSNPDNKEVKEFAIKHEDRIRYYKFLFWIADTQFEQASKMCEDCGLEIGIYQDLAVGVASESAETWGAQDLFMSDLSIGSPPDMFNANGQSWGVAPMNPEQMKAEGYASYRKILSTNMKRAGAVRIDHVMGIARLFCIPSEAPGAYILYPFSDIVGIIALESHRNKCLVIGEDLGVVPSFFREALSQAGILSFRVCRYEKTPDGRYVSPMDYPKSALVAAGTHDMPTLVGYWLADDIKISATFGTLTDEKIQNALHDRLNDRKALVEALSRQGLWFVNQKDFEEQINGNKLPNKFIEAVYTYLSKAPSQVFLVQLEDILGQREQMNMPGTTLEYPNWRFKLPKTLEELENDESMEKICSILKSSRM
ncbi:MAG: 4-alpha-glucanotransferase [Alphaproteobacteria bacterium]|nr:4-alpha-glucanotransferase [Alphaproteobacteria bacterium]